MELTKKAKQMFDVKRTNAGNNYRVRNMKTGKIRGEFETRQEGVKKANELARKMKANATTKTKKKRG